MLEPTSFPPFSGTQGTALLPLPTILSPRDLGELANRGGTGIW